MAFKERSDDSDWPSFSLAISTARRFRSDGDEGSGFAFLDEAGTEANDPFSVIVFDGLPFLHILPDCSIFEGMRQNSETSPRVRTIFRSASFLSPFQTVL